VTLLPWEYLFEPFSSRTFPDLFDPMWISSLILLAAVIVMYNVRTRQLHRHKPYLGMYEWILWTGVVLFSLIPVYAVFRFDFIIVLLTLVTGLGALVWIRFIKFPPELRAYERMLAKQRYFSRERFAKPEATIRTKSSRRRRR
jgi:hypothetical protein